MIKIKSYQNENWLRKKYLSEKLSIQAIAELCGCGAMTIWKHLVQSGIPRRTCAEARRGQRHSEETKRKMRETAKRLWANDQTYRDIHSRAQLGRRHSEETKKRLSKIRRGRPCPWNAKPRSSEIKAKISSSLKLRYADKEFKEKAIRAIMRNRVNLPAPDEKKIIALCEKYKFPFKYVGDGKLIIEGKIPDFIHTKNKKLLIEVYGRPFAGYEQKRVAIFGPLGFKILFLSKKDLQNKNWEIICSRKIKTFIGD